MPCGDDCACTSAFIQGHDGNPWLMMAYCIITQAFRYRKLTAVPRGGSSHIHANSTSCRERRLQMIREKLR